MQVVYYNNEMPEKFSKSLFLVGPSLRQDQKGISWRIEAIQILERLGFDGVVFCPENEDDSRTGVYSGYEETISWEEKYLNVCDCIVAWIPRDLTADPNNFPEPVLPGFTTNIEMGRWESSGKIVLGCPPDAPKNSYLKHYAEQYNVPVSETLETTLENAMAMLGDGAERTGGERYVPLFVWKLDSFQSWYKAQTKVGNRLDEARLLYAFRPRYKNFVFLWILKAKIYVESEDRYKENEFVLARPDISSVCLYHHPKDMDTYLETEVVMVREFRTPASTKDGFILELPSGSSKDNSNPEEVASEELFEETGFYLDPSRLEPHGQRQLAGTLSSHKANLYSAKITKEEMDWFKGQKNVVHGNIEDSEMTYIEVHTVGMLANRQLIDWTSLGMIYSVIMPATY